MQTLDDLQNDMRTAYLHGGTGMLVSGLIWTVAGAAFLRFGVEQGIWTVLVQT